MMYWFLLIDTTSRNELGLQFLGSVFGPFWNGGFSLAILDSTENTDSFTDRFKILAYR